MQRVPRAPLKCPFAASKVSQRTFLKRPFCIALLSSDEVMLRSAHPLRSVVTLALVVSSTALAHPVGLTNSCMSGAREFGTGTLPQQGPTIVLEPKGSHTATVIFLHGLGDTGNGWKDVGEMLQPTLPHIRWVFPTAYVYSFRLYLLVGLESQPIHTDVCT